ncbi:MAG: potassium-transporting ATPase subunit KdpA [Leptospirales bacterium]
MIANDWIQILFSLGVILLLAPLVGRYLAWIYNSPHFSLERGLYRLMGVDPDHEMTWKEYGSVVLVSNAFFFVAGFLVLWAQPILPLNPRNLPALSPELAFNTAASFVTNTNWQAYAGEAQLSNLSQMLAITFLMFVGANTGMASLVAIFRGFTRSGSQTLGNFWTDFVRFFVRAFLPACFLMALIHVSQGSPQTLRTQVTAHTMEGSSQTLIIGPVASLESLKHLGTNGGGFYNANGAHPYENPTPLTNTLEFLEMGVFTFSLPFFFGRMIGRPRQGQVFFIAIFTLYLSGFALIEYSEKMPNPLLAHASVEQQAGPLSDGGNSEGKETRFGITQTSLFSNTTIAATTGAVDGAMDSMSPLSILVYLVHMFLNEEPGGKGVGFAGLLKEAILAIFLAGLMVGRSPEFLGKKIESREIKLAALSLLVTPLLVLWLTGISVLLPSGKSSMDNPGPRGFMEVLYAFSSGNANNGSAMAGLNVSTPYYAILIGVEMLLGRFLPLLPLLALAGALARKKTHPETAGTFKTDQPLFIILLLGFMILFAALTFFPPLMLGPLLEHLSLLHGISF